MTGSVRFKLYNMENEKLVCARCGTEQIEVKAWANPNTETLVNFVEDPSPDETWCPVCEDHTGAVLKSQFGKEEDDEI